MIGFAALLDGLAFAPSDGAKRALLRRYFAGTADPERGWGLAVLSGGLALPVVKPGVLRALAAERVDAVLFGLSHDFVGDLAETLALTWPARASNRAAPGLAEVVAGLDAAGEMLAGWLDAADAASRFALLKLATGGLRPGASVRLVREALAELGDGVSAEAIEEVWHGLAPPYPGLFAWLEGRGARPDMGAAPVFRPMMRASRLDEAGLELAGLRAEWKWDGVRVQLVSGAGGRRLYGRGAEDLSAGFPEIIAAMDFRGVLEGELVAMRDGEVAPFSALQPRLGRRSAGARLRAEHPVGVMLYDMLFEGDEDLRGLPFDARRGRLEDWFGRVAPERMRLSELLEFGDVADLRALRAAGRAGLMLKRGDSAYVAGPPQGLWLAWPRDPLTLDAVLMYAQRGPAGGYGEYSFGVWRADGALVPVGKAGPGGAPEVSALDGWIGAHTVAKFGPVREVERGLVLQVAFDAALRSSRHKSGVVLRGARIVRVRPDKAAGAADRLETVLGLAGEAGGTG